MRRSYDVVVVGGGAMGSSVAYWLARGNKTRRNPVAVAVVERDMTYAQAASALSAGGLRQQFSNPENVLLSQASLGYLRGFEEEFAAMEGREVAGGPPLPFGFRDHGYLVLSGTDSGREVLRENVATQRSLGARTVFLGAGEDAGTLATDTAPTTLGYPGNYKAQHLHSFAQLQSAFPWMNLDGIVAAGYGTADEGWFDAFTYTSALKQYNTAVLGVDYIAGEATAIGQPSDAATHVTVTGVDGAQQQLYFGHMVNAGGTRAARLAEMVGWDTHPVRPKKRYTFHVQCDSWTLGHGGAFHNGGGPGQLPMPLLVDPSGVWVRPEGVGFICGGPLPAHLDVPCDVGDFDVRQDAEDLYEQTIWPALAERIPSFETLRLGNQWAGHYEYNLEDQNAIIGYHPSCSNVVYINGFSGHGIQQSPAAGRAVAELILEGRYETIDVTAMAPTRFDAEKLLIEKNVI